MALWMNQGKVNLTANSKNVVGVGTAFLSAAVPARPGQPIVVNGTVMEIATVNSDTSLTLALPYAGATTANSTYLILTTMEGSYNDLARRAAQVMGLYQGYMDVYEALFTGTGNVTVTLPDGSVIILPAWSTLVSKTELQSAVGSKQPKSQNLTNLDFPSTAFGRDRLKDAGAAEARTALGLGNSATKDSGTSIGNVVTIGTLGFGGSSVPIPGGNHNSAKQSGTYYYTSAESEINGPMTYGAGNVYAQTWGSDNNWRSELAVSVSVNRMFFRSIRTDQTNVTPWVEVKHTGNTTVDANGFLKNASPILHLFSDTYTVNEEAEGVHAVRLSTGVYKIVGSLGFSEDGWYIEGPKDANGRMKFWLDYDQDLNGIITIKTTHREFTEGPASQRNIIPGVKDGDPIDIPVGREITVRLSMPEPDRGYE